MNDTAKFPKRKQIHLKDFDYSNTNFVFFLTLCTSKKQNVFANSEIANCLVNEIDFRFTKLKEITVFAYCIMPDHLHLLLKLNEGYGKTLQGWVAAFKRHTTKTILQNAFVKPLWQTNYYEHIVRKDESLNKIAEYIVNNPVRKGMVSIWEDYAFSKINYSSFK
ncbi:MAG: hypothetical protein A2252_04650 [Elusimicrobia bacterium RIFOXYA2_FULL_39_19]|nr:MAG: hypothetical protein A2252_04650 [Elusimicrobia bacterium RIFOXYA2_FULL_39_19]